MAGLNGDVKRFSACISFTETGSPGFDKFLEILGERIRLKNWDKYRGGLDVKGTVYIS